MKRPVGGCPVEKTLHLIEGRWKVIILNQLFRGGTLRFSELRRRIDAGGTGGRTGAVTPKVLTQELRQMEADRLLHRRVFAEVPPRVEYSLTPLGESLRPVILAMADWSLRHLPDGGDRGDAAPPCGEEREG